MRSFHEENLIIKTADAPNNGNNKNLSLCDTPNNSYKKKMVTNDQNSSFISYYYLYYYYFIFISSHSYIFIHMKTKTASPPNMCALSSFIYIYYIL